MRNKKKVVVFGIFDGVHDGHRDLFRQALRQAQGKPAELIAIVGRDVIAEKLKGKTPRYSEVERVELLKKEPFVDDAVLGDPELSTYKILEELNPSVVCLGYDQEALEEDLQKWVGDRNIKIYRAKPYKEEVFHSSIL